MTPATASGDAELVNASLEGNRDAFGFIVSRYQSLVCSLAYSATGSLSQSEDLAQDTFVAAWKQLADLREPAQLRAWLCGIARNLINNALRSQGREPSHHAAPLDEIAEARSLEPLPVERAISQEEAEILWRSLERIPEAYREPLVLFYREHQSVGTVAQNLELTEETVRQRLSRGRKLLQEEVLAFVEVALEKTSPGKTFTLAVVSALPIAVSSAKAASVGAAAFKVGVEAKSAFSLGALSSLLAMVGAVLFSWKTAVDETKSPRERRLMVRMGWFQVTFLVLSLVASFYWFPSLSHQPVVLGIAITLLILANLINCVVTTDYLNHKRLEIGMEEGTLINAGWTEPGKETNRQAFRKTVRTMIPLLFLFAVGSIGLPWKQHGDRCLVVVAAEALVMLWAFRRFQALLSGQFQPVIQSSRLQKFLRHPVVLLPAILFGCTLLAGFLPFYLNPAAGKTGIAHAPGLRNLGLSLLVAMLAYAAFALVYVWKRKMMPGLDGLRDWIPKTTMKPEAIIETTYAPVFQQLQLNVDQSARVKDLILKKTQAQVRNSMALMNRRLEATKRADLSGQLQRETDEYNAQIKQAIGEESYPTFKEYEISVPNRTMVDLFSGESARKAQALSAEQREQLVQALNEERAQFPWSTDLSRRDLTAGGYAAAFSASQIDTFAREEEQFERQFLIRAQRILSREQIAAFEDFHKRQRKSQITGFKIAAKLFGLKNG
jgi:RNA polymerase sigma factor (sigma-70 family)